jgi:ribosomal protein S18 acetylase RimI-like enzyme
MVHPSAEGVGIGRMLMDAALAQARKQNYDQIRPSVTSSAGQYMVFLGK